MYVIDNLKILKIKIKLIFQENKIIIFLKIKFMLK